MTPETDLLLRRLDYARTNPLALKASEKDALLVEALVGVTALQAALAERTRERDEAIRFHTDEYHNRVALTAALSASQAEVAHWKANHAEAIARQRILTDRPDLPLERVRAFEALREAQAEVARLRQVVERGNAAERQQ